MSETAITHVFHEPVPAYMKRLSLMGARFIVGNDGGAATSAPKEPDAQQGEAPEAGTTEPPVEAGDQFKSEESKKAVLADLAKERDANKDLKARLAAYEQEKQDAEKAKLSDIDRAQAEAQEARDEAATAARELAVYKLAAKHGITDEGDIELLNGIESDEAREKLAARIATPAGPTNPKPDPSQGAKTQEPMTDADKATAAEKAGDAEAAKRLKAQQLGALASKL